MVEIIISIFVLLRVALLIYNAFLYSAVDVINNNNNNNNNNSNNNNNNNNNNLTVKIGDKTFRKSIFKVC